MSCEGRFVDSKNNNILQVICIIKKDGAIFNFHLGRYYTNKISRAKTILHTHTRVRERERERENKVNESRGEIMVYLFHDTRTRSDGTRQLWS